MPRTAEVIVTTKLSSREFNQDTGRAKRAAEDGPVYITDRGRPSHVLLTFAAYRTLAGDHPSMVDLLGEPAGIGEVELVVRVGREVAEPAELD